MLQILSTIAPLFLIIFVSALLQRTHSIGEHWSQVLNDFALKLGLPVLIFSALIKAPFSFSDQAPILISNSVFLIGTFVLALIIGTVLRLKKQLFRTLVICLMFSNIAYLGIPTLVQIRGAAILPIASLIVALYLFWIFTIGIGYLDYTQQRSRKDMLKKIGKKLVKNPLLIAVVLGLVVAGLNISLPQIFLTSMDMVTASVTPTVLIVIGLFVGKSRIGKWSEWVSVGVFSLTTLIVLPALFYFGLKLFGFAPHTYATSIIEAAMPLAITPFALADEFGLDKEFIARSIVLSTILAVLTLPFWISLL